MGRPRAIYENGLNTCSMCKVTKPVSEFSYQNKTRGKLQSRCKGCCAVEFKRYRETDSGKEKFRQYKWRSRPENKARLAEQQRLYVLEHPDLVFKKKRKAHLKASFGMTPEDYDAILTAQKGVCAICGVDKPSAHRRHFYVDHCHTTGKIRGLLCSSCNTGLGHFKDNPGLLTTAISYLEKHL
jgi:hypothetical protein